MKLPSPLDKIFGGNASKVFRGMAMLATGTGLGRLIGLASIPVLTRLYDPNHYGVLAVFTGIISLLAPALNLRYALAIPLPRRDRTAANLLFISFACIGVTSLATCGVMYLFGPFLLRQLSMEVLIPWWWVIVLGSAAIACYESLTMWATRKRAYKTIAKTLITQSVIGETIKITLGLLSIKPFGLLIGQVASQSAGIGALIFQSRGQLRQHARRFDLKLIKRIAHYYRSYATYRLASQLLLALSIQAPIFIAARYYEASVTGQLGLAFMALALPVNLLGESMARAYYAEISAIGRRFPRKVRSLTRSVMKRLLALSLPPTLVLALFGQDIFELCFGEKWSPAGNYASILAIYLAFQFIQKPASYLLYLYDGQRQLLMINAQRVILTAGCFAIGGLMKADMTKVLWFYSAIMSLHYSASILIAIKSIPASTDERP